MAFRFKTACFILINQLFIFQFSFILKIVIIFTNHIEKGIVDFQELF